MITAENADNHRITRNISHYKQFNDMLNNQPDDSDSELDITRKEVRMEENVNPRPTRSGRAPESYADIIPSELITQLSF